MRKSGLVKNAIRGRIEGEFVELVNVKSGNFLPSVGFDRARRDRGATRPSEEMNFEYSGHFLICMALRSSIGDSKHVNLTAAKSGPIVLKNEVPVTAMS